MTSEDDSSLESHLKFYQNFKPRLCGGSRIGSISPWLLGEIPIIGAILDNSLIVTADTRLSISRYASKQSSST
ncbi:MAG: hypothetical protein DMG05_27300 [Acidobacteria bacterium]|nr:MAG: hypothetical protein DMG05_27300 [Acidobacteriota bacterium]